jgi:hypothetical protein
MKRIFPSPLRFVAAFALLIWLTPAPTGQTVAGAPADDATVREKIDRWIADLSSDDFEVREAATRELKGRAEAAPALRKALRSEDKEVVQRATEILKALHEKLALRELKKATDLAKEGRIDEVVERLVRWQEFDREKTGWKAVGEFVAKVLECEKRDFDTRGLLKERFPQRDFSRYLQAEGLTEIASPGKTLEHELLRGRETVRKAYLVRGEEIEVESPLVCDTVAASRSVRLKEVRSCVIVSAGDVEVGKIDDSVVVCDGVFKASGSILNCLIVARGNMTCPPTTGMVILSCGEIKFPNSTPTDRAVLRSGEAVPFKFIKFFDLAEAGVEVSKCDGGVAVASVAKGKAFADAGLQKDDVVTAVDGEKVTKGGGSHDEVDQFRRSLRKKLAAGEEATLTVRRGDKTLELTVLPED